MKLIGSIDQGTTSTRFIIFSEDGKIVASSQKEHQQIFPKEGWVEHDANEIWENTVETITQALKTAKVKPSDLSAIGITNQRETTVMWRKSTGEPICNALVWQDTRSEDICHKLSQKEGGKDRLRKRTGLPIVPYFSATKIRWLMDNNADVIKAVSEDDAMFGTIDSWLCFKLSNNTKHITDVTNASRTLLMNINTLEWDASLCKEFDIPMNILPTVVASSKKHFVIQHECLKDVPLSGILGDQSAALFGQTCFEVGSAKNTYGTGCFLLLNTGTTPVQSTHGLLTTVGYQLENSPAVYALEGSVAIGGALVQWLRDNLNLITDAPAVEELANTVKDNGGVYFVPAFSGLYAPYWRDDARGVIVGLTRFVNKGHIARATIEATAFQTMDVFRAMEKDAGVGLHSLRVDGGMTANNLLLQFQADILNVPVVLPKVSETTALGAAFAAGLGVGVYKNLDELKKTWKINKQASPSMANDKRDELISKWKMAIERTLNWHEPNKL